VEPEHGFVTNVRRSSCFLNSKLMLSQQHFQQCSKEKAILRFSGNRLRRKPRANDLA